MNDLNSDEKRFVNCLTEFNKVLDGSADVEFCEQQILDHIGKNYDKFNLLLRRSAEDKQIIFKQFAATGASPEELKQMSMVIGIESAAAHWILKKAKAKHNQTLKKN